MIHPLYSPFPSRITTIKNNDHTLYVGLKDGSLFSISDTRKLIHKFRTQLFNIKVFREYVICNSADQVGIFKNENVFFILDLKVERFSFCDGVFVFSSSKVVYVYRIYASNLYNNDSAIFNGDSANINSNGSKSIFNGGSASIFTNGSANIFTNGSASSGSSFLGNNSGRVNELISFYSSDTNNNKNNTDMFTPIDDSPRLVLDSKHNISHTIDISITKTEITIITATGKIFTLRNGKLKSYDTKMNIKSCLFTQRRIYLTSKGKIFSFPSNNTNVVSIENNTTVVSLEKNNMGENNNSFVENNYASIEKNNNTCCIEDKTCKGKNKTCKVEDKTCKGKNKACKVENKGKENNNTFVETNRVENKKTYNAFTEGEDKTNKVKMVKKINEEISAIYQFADDLYVFVDSFIYRINQTVSILGWWYGVKKELAFFRGYFYCYEGDYLLEYKGKKDGLFEFVDVECVL